MTHPLPRYSEQLRRQLAAKNRYNAATVTIVLLMRSIALFVSLLLLTIAADLWSALGAFAIVGPLVAVPLFLTGYSALLERAVLGFRELAPRFCSIYDRYFWYHERCGSLMSARCYTRPRSRFSSRG